MVTLAEAILLVPERKNGPTCSVGDLLGTLTEQDAATLVALLAGFKTSANIVRALEIAGYMIAVQSLNRHRRGECRCTSVVES